MDLVQDNIAEIYQFLRSRLLNAPIISPRGIKTKEILVPRIVLTNPRNRFMYHPNRTYNLPFNIVEFLFMVTGANSVKYLEFYNPNVSQFSDNGLTFYGAYGTRIAGYFTSLIKKLKSDINTRQAVLSIYNSADMIIDTKDVPCTLALNFMIRDNKLDLITYMRSNDLFWGFQYDVVNFTLIQELIANELGIDVGNYYHIPTSLHVYEKHFGLLEDIPKMDLIETPIFNWLSFDIAENISLFSKILVESSRNDWQNIFNEYYFLIRSNDFGLILFKYYTKKTCSANYSEPNKWFDIYVK